MVSLSAENLLEQWIPGALVIDLEMPDGKFHVMLSFFGSDVLCEAYVLPCEQGKFSVLFNQKLLCARFLDFSDKADH